MVDDADLPELEAIPDAGPADETIGGPRPAANVIPAAEPRSVADSNRPVEKTTNKLSALHVVALALADPMHVALMNFVAAVSKPLEIEMNTSIIAMKTGMGATNWGVEMASLERVQHLFEMVGLLQDDALLLLLGVVSMHSCQPGGGLSAQDANQLAQIMADIIRCTIAEEFKFIALCHFTLPGRFAALLNHELRVRASASDYCRRCFEAVTKLEKGSPWAKELARELLWPNACWIREILIGLLEGEWDVLPTDIETEIRDSLRIRGTKASEDMFNFIRKVMRTHLAHNLGRLGQWHKTLHSKIIRDNDCQPIVVNAEDKDMRMGIHEGVCNQWTHDEFSIGDEHLA